MQPRGTFCGNWSRAEEFFQLEPSSPPARDEVTLLRVHGESFKTVPGIWLCIPTGFRPEAQGCETRATLGKYLHHTLPQRGYVSIPNISFIPFDFMFAQKRPDLVLKRHFSVMFFLSGDVAFDLLEARLADGEVRVARLPFKVGKACVLLLQPFVRDAFQFLHPFGLGEMVRPKRARICT